MIKNKTFYIRYYATKHKNFISRKAKWDNKSKVWETKTGQPAITYYDLDQDNYRTAKGDFSIKYV
jgi:hypothetical protein